MYAIYPNQVIKSDDDVIVSQSTEFYDKSHKLAVLYSFWIELDTPSSCLGGEAETKDDIIVPSHNSNDKFNPLKFENNSKYIIVKRIMKYQNFLSQIKKRQKLHFKLKIHLCTPLNVVKYPSDNQNNEQNIVTTNSNQNNEQNIVTTNSLLLYISNLHINKNRHNNHYINNTKFAGLVNLGNTCYLNSGIQTVFYIAVWRDVKLP